MHALILQGFNTLVDRAQWGWRGDGAGSWDLPSGCAAASRKLARALAYERDGVGAAGVRWRKDLRRRSVTIAKENGVAFSVEAGGLG